LLARYPRTVAAAVPVLGFFFFMTLEPRIE